MTALRPICQATLATLGMMFASATSTAQQTADAPDFNRDIRPILSNHCFQCHGSDNDARQADLRLDDRDAAMSTGAITPATDGTSPLVQRITSSDPADRMPPDDAHKPLTARQIELLKQWIESGAAYDEHWAFRHVERPAVPIPKASTVSGNPIDAFIAQRLTAAELQPSPEADRATLIRRMTQDLLGLLPSPEEAAAFQKETARDAVEQLVDRLLASPHYGERWGRHWLDQARYADSNGFTIDSPRVMWPYRDWVIAAFNNDMPFDQFTIEQLAGDLLPEPSTAQRVASAFHRNTMINEEGGVKPDQYRHEALIDRVNTTGAVWLGLTVGCAQCHSHKFDPISHEEYYRLYAFFNGASDANNAGETIEVRHGEMFGWSDQQTAALAELRDLKQEQSALEKKAAQSPDLADLPWDWKPLTVQSVSASGQVILAAQDDGTLLAKPDNANHDAFTIRFDAPRTADGALLPVTAIRLQALTDPGLPASGPGTASNGNFVLSDVSLRKKDKTPVRFLVADASHSQPNHDVADAIDDIPKTGWAINVDGRQVAAGVKMNQRHIAVFALSEPMDLGEQFEVVLRHDVNKDYLIGHFRIEVSTTTALPKQSDDPSSTRLLAVKSRIAQLEAVLPAKGVAAKQMVMKDMADPPLTHLLTRGDFLTPNKNLGPLSPGVPASLLAGATAPAFTNRLDLARWLVSRDNPLTARVTVNRIWAKYFGRGLVETENDFGYQSTPPSHPELLDWLAAELMDSGWSLKHIHRLIVTSATYRQSSLVPASNDHDPLNLLLSRQSRFRVEAEIVRDQALAASGLLNSKLGGPGVHLPQPDGIYDFTQNKKDWPTESGPSRFRRTMYAMFYRSAPYPLLSTFDAPDFSTVCTCRVRSNTPLQSLATANDPMFQELAAGLARRVLAASDLSLDDERVTLAFKLCLTRAPSPPEREVLISYVSRERSRFVSQPEEAARFVTRTDADPPLEELAAWTSLARALFNTDEFVMRN